MKLIVAGDQAFTEDEWEAEQRRHDADRRYRQTHREQINAYQRQYRVDHRETLRKYQREWMRAYRASQRPVGHLHELTCPGDHTRPRKACKPIPVFQDDQ